MTPSAMRTNPIIHDPPQRKSPRYCRRPQRSSRRMSRQSSGGRELMGSLMVLPILKNGAATAYQRRPEPPPASTGRGDLERHDLVRILDRLAPLQFVDRFHAVRHFTPHGVLAVEKMGIGEADKELAVGRIGIVGAGHGADAADVRCLGE